MAEATRPRLRLRASERRLLMMVGDLVASIGANRLSPYLWRQYQIYHWISLGIRPGRAEALAKIEVPVWFYLLPLAWLILMSEMYDPHASVSLRRTLRGTVIAAVLGMIVYSLVFILN